MWNLFHEHTELWPLATPFEEEYLGYPLTILTYEAGPLGISIVLFLVFLFVKGGWGLAGRFFAFWFLLFVLLLTTGTFIQAMFPFVLIPRAPSPVSDWMILGVIIFLSAVLSGFLVWKAK